MTEPHPFAPAIDLAQPRLGSRVVFATDDFFADKSRMILPSDPVWIADKYDDNGKWMDGWESRRKRTPGHDYAIVRIGIPGIIRGVDIDTRHFVGNHPPHASLDACIAESDIPPDDVDWQPILDRRELGPNRQHFFAIQSDVPYTHLRLNIFPDGGVARLRIYGDVSPDWTALAAQAPIDLFAVENGGRALACNDERFGTMHNLNAPGRGENMGDGWETARRRELGNDWVIVALGKPGIVERVLIDTAHFKGNYPDRVMLQAASLDTATKIDAEWIAASEDWPVMLPTQTLAPDAEHVYVDELALSDTISHVRMNIYPDGGISRLRLFGSPVPGA
ncbi:MAG: allantoicase [Pseudomonadota bacterium]